MKNFHLFFSTRTCRKGSLSSSSFSKVKVKKAVKSFCRKKTATVLFLIKNSEGVIDVTEMLDGFAGSRKQFLSYNPKNILASASQNNSP